MDLLAMVILDEADRMLDMGFVDDIKTILRQMPEKRRTVFFSATIPRPIQQLIQTFTHNPVNVRVEASTGMRPTQASSGCRSHSRRCCWSRARASGLGWLVFLLDDRFPGPSAAVDKA